MKPKLQIKESDGVYRAAMYFPVTSDIDQNTRSLDSAKSLVNEAAIEFLMVKPCSLEIEISEMPLPVEVFGEGSRAGCVCATMRPIL